MKKLIAIVSALFLFPFTALALTPMQDDQMNDVTGQAGVSIAIDTHVALHVDTIAWGDSDGTDGAGAEDGGWVGVSDMNGSFFVGLRSDHSGNKEVKFLALATGAASSSDTAVLTAAGAFATAKANLESDPSNTTYQTEYADAVAGLVGAAATSSDSDDVAAYNAYNDFAVGIDKTALEVLTIDVASSSEYDTYSTGEDVAYVRIGLGTFEVSGNMDMTFELGSEKTLGQELGTLDIQGMVVRGAAGNFVNITTEGRKSGVTLDMGVHLDQINIASLAWGDSDGMDTVYDVDTDVTGGYVGLADLDIDNLKIDGKVAIDVATILDTTGVATDLALSTDYKQHVLHKLAGLMAANPGDLSATQVILSLGDADGTAALTWDATNEVWLGDDTAINISMGSLEATAAIGSDVNMANNAVLGNIYVAGAQVAVDGLVSISAH
ncbi:MAG: hypothetical protein HUN04_25090 [Desulfobacter sp.]|nr:MAG: hypothetical protein HUN04_25090 [Desulfobacter sp.]